MYPTQVRVRELQDRFDVHNGQFFGEYRYKNLNWYLATSTTPIPEDEWFCYGDIREEDIERVQFLLAPGEVLILGWKDMPAAKRQDGQFDGHGVWLTITDNTITHNIAERTS